MTDTATYPPMTPDGARGTAVITGGVGGIGIAIGRRLARRGLRIALWDRDPAVAAAAASLAPDALACTVDITDPDAVAAATQQVLADAGRIDVLVNSAGITGGNGPVEDYDIAEWRRIMAINMEGTFFTCRAILPAMKAADYGRIVNIASIAGKEGNPFGAAYSASKGAVIAFTKALAKELVTTNIRANSVAPAMIETAMLNQMTPEFVTRTKAKIPLGRFGTADEVAALCEWLASPECSFSTGAVFDVSGGRATY